MLAASGARGKQRRKRSAIDAAEPNLTFDVLELRFLNDLARRKKSDYSIGELDRFVQSLGARMVGSISRANYASENETA